MTATYPTQDDLRLEVEEDLPAGALENLVANPSGDLGGWGWRTPVAGSTMVGTADTGPGALAVAGRKLIYRSPGGVASSFTTEAFAVAPSEYVAASWRAPYVAGQYRVRVEWLNASQVLLSSSAQTAYATTSAATVNLASVQAPASTAFARLRFDHYANTSAGNPTAGQEIALQEVTVAKAAGALGSTRTNLIPNPSFEIDTSGWGAQFDGTIVRTTAITAYSGTACLRAYPTSGNSDILVAPGLGGGFSSLIPIKPAKRYTLSAYLRAHSVGRTCRVGIWWYTAGGKYLGASSGVTNMVDSGTWTRNSSSGTAPASAAYARPWIWWAGVNLGEFHYVDAVQLEERATASTYLDGSLAAGGGTTYAWTGTAHASPSTATTTTLDFVEPVSYLDVLGPTHEIKITREELNLGVLSATVLDAALDPSQGGIIRPGKACRLSVWDPAAGRLETLFTGEISQASVQYHLDRQDEKRARISMEAVDAGAKLAATTRKVGVGTIDALPYVLEGAGVPWTCNGNSNQVPSATVASTNDQASALDQVAVTRDSRNGYAWVDRYGVLRAYDPDKMPSKNYLPNGDLAVDGTGWTGQGGSFGRLASVAKVSTTPLLEIVCSGSLSSGGFYQSQIGTTPTTPGTYPVTPATPLSLSAEVYAVKDAALAGGTVDGSAYMVVTFTDAAGTFLSQLVSPNMAVPRGKWGTLTYSGTVPANAAYGTFTVVFRGIQAIGDRFYLRRPFVGAEAFQVLDEAAYSDLDVGFDTEQCINQVTLKYLRYKSATTEEVPYGPYTNADSVARWGPRASEFTVHGITETGPTLQAFADKILAVNAEPMVRANGAKVPVRSAGDLPRALLDLYTLAYVRHAGLGVDNLSRVTRIEHSIAPGAWLLDLGFQQTGSVAAPQVTPPVNVNAGLPPFASRYNGGAQTAATSAWTDLSLGTNVETTGVGYSGGTFTIQRPGRYLVACAATFATGSTGRRILRSLVNGVSVDWTEANGDDANDWTLRVCKPVRLAVGDAVTFAVYQSSGAGLAVNAGLHLTHAEISWIGD